MVNFYGNIYIFLNFLCRRDRSRTCFVCSHFSFDVAPLHEMPSVKITKIFYPRAQPLFCLLDVLCCVVPVAVAVAVAVAVVVFLNSLFKSALYVFCYRSFPGPFVPSRLSCFAPLLRKHVFHVKYVKRKVGLLRYIGKPFLG